MLSKPTHISHHSYLLDSGAKTAIMYLRVSTSGQDTTGNGYELQLKAIEAFASVGRFRIVATYREAASAAGRSSVYQRPELAKALNHALEAGSVLVVYDFGRLSRDTLSFEVIASRFPASRILSVSDGGSLEEAFREGTLARGQAERELISSSTKMGLARKKATGTKLGNPHIKDLSPKGSEAWKQETHSRSKDIAKVILKMGWPQAVISNGYLANELNHRGLLTGHGLPFDPRRVAGPRKSAEDLLRRAQEGVHGRKAAGAACCSAQTAATALQEAASLDEAKWSRPPSFGRF